MSNIIDSIKLSGTVYTLSAQTEGGGVPESAFTAYTAATDERISQDEEVTAAALNVLNESLSGKQDTLSAGTNITISGNVISAEGGGKAIKAGRGISITTGETADTVSLGVPISAGTGTNSIIEGDNRNTADGYSSHAEGYRTLADGYSSHAEGDYTKANGISSHAEGYWTTAATDYSHAEGQYTKTTNQSEHASGQYNVSHSATTEFGDSGNTLFSVGNGDWSARHNAFEIRQNGDIYLSSGGTDIKLQDHLGGGGNPTVELTQAEYDALVSAGTVSADTFYIITDAQAGDLTNYYTKSETNTLLGGKQATLVSGTNIKTINNESILGSGNIDIQGGGGGGKAIEAGTNISVTTGETADTINCTIPYEGNPAYRLVFGYGVNNKSQYSIVVGVYTNTTSSTQNNIAVGYDCHSKASNNATFGVGNNSLNQGELSAGLYNISNTGSTDADKTLFSVGDGTSTSARHNAFEIRQNGDIYITINGQDVKLQDILLQLSGTTS